MENIVLQDKRREQIKIVGERQQIHAYTHERTTTYLARDAKESPLQSPSIARIRARKIAAARRVTFENFRA